MNNIPKSINKELQPTGEVGLFQDPVSARTRRSSKTHIKKTLSARNSGKRKAEVAGGNQPKRRRTRGSDPSTNITATTTTTTTTTATRPVEAPTMRRVGSDIDKEMAIAALLLLSLKGGVSVEVPAFDAPVFDAFDVDLALIPLYLNQCNYAEAEILIIKWLDLLLINNNLIGDLLICLSTAYRMQGKDDEAEKAARDGLMLPTSSSIRAHLKYQLVLVCAKKNQSHQAEVEVREALDIEGISDDLRVCLWYMLALVCRDQYKYTEAEAAARKCLELPQSEALKDELLYLLDQVCINEECRTEAIGFEPELNHPLNRPLSKLMEQAQNCEFRILN